jgi:hypothetical protein
MACMNALALLFTKLCATNACAPTILSAPDTVITAFWHCNAGIFLTITTATIIVSAT